VVVVAFFGVSRAPLAWLGLVPAFSAWSYLLVLWTYIILHGFGNGILAQVARFSLAWVPLPPLNLGGRALYLPPLALRG
jgi:hypothetical protein